MKKIVALLLFAFVFPAALQAQTPYLEIHHIGAGEGDATLIIAVDSTGTNPFTHQPVWDTCTVLIDGQKTSSSGNEVWRYVHDTITARFPQRLRIDFVVVSHLHEDHYGGLTTFLKNANTNNWPVNYLITRRALASTDSTLTYEVVDTCYSEVKVSNANGTKLNQFFAAARLQPIDQPSVQPKINLFYYKNFKNISMQCIVACGVTIGTNNNLYSFLPKNASGKNAPKSENDLSYGWLLTFQGFHYVTMGDLGGVNGSRYVDGETPVTKYLTNRFNDVDYHLCAYKVSHHGSAESTTGSFARENSPSLAIFPASLKAFGKSIKPLPTQVAIQNMDSSVGGVRKLFTFVPNNPGKQSSYWTYNNLLYYQDVVLKISSPGYPDFDEDLPITVVQAVKDLNFKYLSVSVDTYKCTKGHDWNNR